MIALGSFEHLHGIQHVTGSSPICMYLRQLIFHERKIAVFRQSYFSLPCLFCTDVYMHICIIIILCALSSIFPPSLMPRLIIWGYVWRIQIIAHLLKQKNIYFNLHLPAVVKSCYWYQCEDRFYSMVSCFFKHY